MIGEPNPNGIIDNIGIRVFTLTDDEAKALYSFLLQTGYISYEFHMLIILLTRRLAKYLEGKSL